jgi:hypothetical protein
MKCEQVTGKSTCFPGPCVFYHERNTAGTKSHNIATLDRIRRGMRETVHAPSPGRLGVDYHDDGGRGRDVSEEAETRAREAITAAIAKADAAFGYSFNLTSLIDGVATHTLTIAGTDPIDFEDREDGYQVIEEHRNRARAYAVLDALASLAKEPRP